MCSSPEPPNREEVNVTEGAPALLRVFAALSSSGLKLVRSARAYHDGNAVWVYVPSVLAMRLPDTDAESVLKLKVAQLRELGAAE